MCIVAAFEHLLHFIDAAPAHQFSEGTLVHLNSGGEGVKKPARATRGCPTARNPPCRIARNAGTILPFMDEQITLPDAPGAPSIRRYRPYVLILAGLFFVHAALTLQLFGPGDPFPNLLSEEPITSGRHALHLHQGGHGVGARTVAEPARYDPSYFAGYPPTPVVDAEARPLNWYRL